MKVKKVLAFAGILIVTGLTCFIIGFGRVGFDFANLDTTEYTAHTLDLSNSVFAGSTQIDAVDIDISSFKIKIVHGEFRIDYYTCDKTVLHTQYEQKDGKMVLSFGINEKWTWYIGMFRGIKKANLQIVISVPERIDFVINAASADLEGENLKFVGLDIKGNSADVNLSGIECDSFDFSGNSADMKIERMQSGAASIASSSSKISIKNANIGEFSFSGNSSKLFINDSECNKLSFGGSSSKLEMKKSTASDITAEGSSSDFNFIQVNAESISTIGNSSDTLIDNCVIADFIKSEGHSSDTDIYSTSAKNFSGQGNSAEVYLDNSSFESIRFSGSSSKVKTKSAIRCDKVDFAGNSSDFIITLYGQKEDFASISMSGSSSRFKLEGEKFAGSYFGLGAKTFTMTGNSAECELSFGVHK